jgi:glucose-6-phosphate 1-dehydrogenase
MIMESQMVIIFGGTGDLTKRKLIPSLYHLLKKKELTACTPIICIGRQKITRESFLQELTVERFIEDVDDSLLQDLLGRVEYLCFDVRTGSAGEFSAEIKAVRQKYRCAANSLIYLALPTGLFPETADLIQTLHDEKCWQRVVFEKPFGTDVASAKKLNENIMAVLEEDQIFRVDHYLGKELVQNILTLRFANEIFANAWHAQCIDHIQITVSETLGVEKRAGYYDSSGAVRDMVQNHLLQLLSFVAMEPPRAETVDALRDAAAAVIARLRQVERKDVVLGQYGPGVVNNSEVAGYKAENGVPDDSATETYAALRAYVDTPRWQGVPFYLRTGKRLKDRYADIKLVFKHNLTQMGTIPGKPNMIIIRIQPDEGIALAFNVRKPGDSNTTEPVLMDFCHHCHFGPNTPEAYESILRNVMLGDRSIFPRWDWILASWKYIDDLRSKAGGPKIYPAGSEGPAEADVLLAQDGRRWLSANSSRQIIPLHLE